MSLLQEPFVRRIAENGAELFEIGPWKEDEELSAGFTGRGGGVSEGFRASLNCALHVGDNPEHVALNRARVAEAAGFRFEDWTCGEQVHLAEVAIVTAEDRGRGRLERADAFQDTDGLLTDVPGVMLTSFYADCVPLYFFDPARRVVGLAHAGWKGTVARIGRRMVEAMTAHYGSDPADIQTAIGPSIGESRYEVDRAVLDRVRVLLEEEPGNDSCSISDFSQDLGGGTALLNLKELNRHIMIKAGIRPESIVCTNWCTSSRTDLFFSHRQENGRTGRMASWIGRKEGGTFR
ncbi:peptidoglycan editing factor PgeF [Saccharibacillus sp. CPCC 101409]|uniref:peptidoglycan editing factor PgeF n=1 Tax=Saccharibacillus sp. CPCC 101409 TaxID=3058041 RepID=UPI0026719271|nr:peptidoglycan editing factor PgeF [Saccharibacillus sp. CPCC 101409]MDO3409216.1 peptidoglycan editing factor PgeF [Saccharibacillus sp. CPCC 101409]